VVVRRILDGQLDVLFGELPAIAICRGDRLGTALGRRADAAAAEKALR
jgi:hypothetical protein